jgi:hypothetical protein
MRTRIGDARFLPQHSNRDYAQQRSMTRDVFVNTPFNMGMVSRLMTDWAGPRSTVRRMKLAMRGNVCAGDNMIRRWERRKEVHRR